MKEQIPCTICGKKIISQEILLCADCKIGIRVEYEAIKKQTESQMRIEKSHYDKYKSWVFEE